MPVWSGRFSKSESPVTSGFNSSIAFDCVLYKQDIAGSRAHAAMLADCGILSAEDAAAIDRGLAGILADLESGKLAFDPGAEDIHMFIEQELTGRIGDAGKKLHTARSRNDQVALDLRLYLREKIAALDAAAKDLALAMTGLAEKHLGTVMPGYTHLQGAQPVTFAHWLMAYVQMLLRDRSRLSGCLGRMNYCPLGSCALAGTSWPISREETARALGFTAPCPNTMDAVADRDFCLELAADLSILMMHLSRLSEEIVLFSTNEFGYLTLDDAYATGSSIMPQKRNPDLAELVRGKTGRVYGDLMNLLTMQKGLPLAYDKDMQEDKQAVFDAVDTALACLGAMKPMLETASVNAGRMRAAAAAGFINATDCADYLTGKGVPFRDAYRVTGALVRTCAARGLTLEQLPLADYRAAHPAFDEGIYAAIALEHCVQARNCTGGPAPETVQKQIDAAKAALAE